MPIEKTYSDAMLGTFRSMLQNCADKKMSGEHFEMMKAVMQTMEDLALEMNDLSAFSAKLSTDGLFTKFSTAYGALLAAEGKKQYNTGDAYDDEKLLQQTVEAYNNSLSQLNDHPDKEKLQAPIQAVIQLGRSGINYPTFLRLLIEQGLDKSMEGVVITRETVVKDIAWATDLILPVYIRRNTAILEMYDIMAAEAVFNIPDSMVFNIQRFVIETKFQPEINKYDAIVTRWNRLLTLLHDWIDAYTSFAPYDDRYVSLKGIQETQRNIKFYKDCNPGFFAVREDIFKRYFSMQWQDIFSHESFVAERKARRCLYTDEYIDFLKKVYDTCKPLMHAPTALIAKAEQLHQDKAVYIK